MFNGTRKKQLNPVRRCSIKCYSGLNKRNENSHRSTRTSFFSFPQPPRAFFFYFSLLSNLPTTQKGLCGEESSMRMPFVSYDGYLDLFFYNVILLQILKHLSSSSVQEILSEKRKSQKCKYTGRDQFSPTIREVSRSLQTDKQENYLLSPAPIKLCIPQTTRQIMRTKIVHSG